MKEQSERKELEHMMGLGLALAEDVRKNVTHIGAPDLPTYVYRAVQFSLFCRGYKSAQAIVNLWMNGYSQDAGILCRSLFEVFLQAGYIDGDPIERAKRYADFDTIQRMRLYEDIKNSGAPDLINLLDAEATDLESLKANYKKLKDNYSGMFWWGNTMKWLAGELHVLPQYLTLQWKVRGLSHGASSSMKHYMKNTRTGVAVDCYASDSRPADIVVQTAFCVIRLADVAAQALELDLRRTIDDAFEEFEKSMARLEELRELPPN